MRYFINTDKRMVKLLNQIGARMKKMRKSMEGRKDQTKKKRKKYCEKKVLWGKIIH